MSADQQNDDGLSNEEERALFVEEREATLAFARERSDRIYQLHRDGMTPNEIARLIGGLAPGRVRTIIARAEQRRRTGGIGGR